MLQLMRHQSTSGRAGTDYLSEIGRRVRFFRLIEVQKWTPLMHEIRLAYGIRCFGFEISFARRRRKFLDGKSPATQRI